MRPLSRCTLVCACSLSITTCLSVHVPFRLRTHRATKACKCMRHPPSCNHGLSADARPPSHVRRHASTRWCGWTSGSRLRSSSPTRSSRAHGRPLARAFLNREGRPAANATHALGLGFDGRSLSKDGTRADNAKDACRLVCGLLRRKCRCPLTAAE